ncbi:DUF4843 domain-containing protein [Proteiniphilum sp. UBA5384]|uniref:DUF4843 domain-containing protein n=1 Tax=Proteiniphilum sp. UBA5384 TaxID=1947279 RepID=UPI0025DA1681|nr:DUF4843 domain-containing protein [Proteiniphilum sp. UBA5384]
MKYVLPAFLSILLLSCQNESFYYQDEARARLEGPYEWALGTDSLDYSFAFYPSSVTETAMNMTLFIMGKTTPNDRLVKLEVVLSETTALPEQYLCPTEIKVPANTYSVPFNVVLKRTSNLSSQNVRLRIRIADSGDFKTGVVEHNGFTIKWNDMLSRPRNWDELTEFFGTFSLTKFRFIIDTLGIGEFDTNTMTWGQLNNYRIVMKNALTTYNEAHPGNPLKDENGQLVNF